MNRFPASSWRRFCLVTGQMLLPILDLVRQGGLATLEAILRMSAEQVAGFVETE